MKIPQLLLRQLYTFGSLTNAPDGARFSLKNRLSDVTLTRIVRVRIGTLDLPAKDLQVDMGDGRWRACRGDHCREAGGVSAEDRWHTFERPGACSQTAPTRSRSRSR